MNYQLYKFHILLFLIFSIPIASFSQDTLDLIANPSFESEPTLGKYYKGTHIDEFINSWFDCGLYNFPNETQPDIHSEETEFWSVKQIPSNGNTFLGMVARDNGTWESITQKLKNNLEKEYCYQFTIDLSKVHKYVSKSHLSDKLCDYIAPAVLQIWIGDNYCDKSQLIYESPPIGRDNWQSYEIAFKPKSNYNYIILQTYYINEDYYQNGHILLDNISPFIMTNCDE